MVRRLGMITDIRTQPGDCSGFRANTILPAD